MQGERRREGGVKQQGPIKALIASAQHLHPLWVIFTPQWEHQQNMFPLYSQLLGGKNTSTPGCVCVWGGYRGVEVGRGDFLTYEKGNVAAPPGGTTTPHLFQQQQQ